MRVGTKLVAEKGNIQNPNDDSDGGEKERGGGGR